MSKFRIHFKDELGDGSIDVTAPSWDRLSGLLKPCVTKVEEIGPDGQVVCAVYPEDRSGEHHPEY